MTSDDHQHDDRDETAVIGARAGTPASGSGSGSEADTGVGPSAGQTHHLDRRDLEHLPPPADGTREHVDALGTRPPGPGPGADDHPPVAPAAGGRPRRRRGGVIAAVVVAILLVAATAALAGLRLVHEGEILPNTSIAGIDVGGLDLRSAERALGPVLASRSTDPVDLRFEDREFRVVPDDIDFGVDLDATLAAAMARGRDGGLVTTTVEHVRSRWRERDYPLVLDWDEDLLADRVAALADRVDRDTFDGAVTADPATLEVTVDPPVDGAAVRTADARAAILNGFRLAGPVVTDLPVDVDPARLESAAVARTAEQVRRAIAQPLRLGSGRSDAVVVLRPRELARMIRTRIVDRGDGSELILVAPPPLIQDVIGERAERFRVDPVDARFEVPRQPPVLLDDKGTTSWEPRRADVTIVASEIGYGFDLERAAPQITRLLRDGTRSAQLRLGEIEPEFSTADAEDLRIDHLLGTFTTYHSCCQNRVLNIQRLADMVDHTLVLPGEQFSVNQISGERTCARGFHEAGMILRGEIVDVCGGGVSQFGTTTVNAVFFSGLKPDAYKPHSFYISRYPMGREATLNYPSPDIDVRFTNDTGNGILVKTWYTSTSITVSFYGTHPNLAEVTALHGSPYNYRSYDTEYREDKSLPPGTEKVVQSGQDGFSVTVTRRVRYSGGRQFEDDWSWTYVPEREIIERNTDPPPAPGPEPTPPGGGG